MRPLRGLGAIGMAVLFAVSATACGDDDGDATSDAAGPAGSDAGSGPAAGEPIRIGFPALLSGPGAVPQFNEAAQVYVDDWNERGGFNGRPVELVVEDVGTDPAQASAAAQKLVTQDNVVAVISHNANANCAVNMPTYVANQVPVLFSAVDTSCADPAVSFGFLNVAQDNGVPAAAWLLDQGATKLGFLGPDVPGVGSAADGIAAYLEDSGEEDLVVELVPPTGTAADYDAAIASFKSQGVDGVFALSNAAGAGTVVSSATSAGFAVDDGTHWVFGPTLYSPAVIDAVPEMDGGGWAVLTQTMPFEIDDPDVQAIHERLSEDVEAVDGFAGLGYQLGAALEAVAGNHEGDDVTRESMLAAMQATTEVTLPLSTLTPSLTSLDNPPAAGVVVAEGGEFVVEAPFFIVE